MKVEFVGENTNEGGKSNNGILWFNSYHQVSTQLTKAYL